MLPLYRALLRLYPARFREEYETLLRQAYAEERAEARGPVALARLWLRLAVDFARSWPVEIAAELRQDLAHAVRVYASRPLFTLFTVGALAVGLGGTAGVFAVVNALLLRPLPFREAPRLVVLDDYRAEPVAGTAGRFQDWLAASRGFLDDALVYSVADDMNAAVGSVPVRVRVTKTSGNFFSMLGAVLARGPGFPEGASSAEAAVISDDCWRVLFGGSPDVIGRVVRVNGRPLAVVGVTRAGFDYPTGTAVWTNSVFTWPSNDGSYRLVIVGRLLPGLSAEQAQPIFRTQLMASRVKSNRGAKLVPLQAQIAGRFGVASTVLLGAALCVLLIACANVANVLLTRVSERRSELAIRAALGASRARLVQQLVAESLLLSFAGGAAGIAVAWLTTRVIASIEPPALATQQYTVFDWRILLFTAALSAAVGLLFAVLPASRAARWAAPGHAPARPHRRSLAAVRHALLGGQVALSLILVAGSVALAGALRSLVATDFGFERRGIVAVSVSTDGSAAHTRATARDYYAAVAARLQEVPGVRAVGGVNFLPFGQSMYFATNFTLNWRLPPDGEYLDALGSLVTPGYFRTMGIAMLAGRDFVAADRDADPPVVIVSEEFAREAGGAQALVGRTLEHGRMTRTVVGVVRSVRYKGPGAKVYPQIYEPIARAYWPHFTFVLDARGREREVLAAAVAAVRAVDATVPVYGAASLDQRLAQLLAEPRFYTAAAAGLAGFALLLAVLGVYAMVSYAVQQRRHEIGIRLAIGATAGAVRGRFVGLGLAPLLAGGVVGGWGAWAMGTALGSLFTGAVPVAPVDVTAAALLLTTTGLAAGWIATSRIVRLDAVDVLRSE